MVAGATSGRANTTGRSTRDRACSFLVALGQRAAVPLVIPIVILGGFFLGVFTATEAGAVVAGYAFVAARFYYQQRLLARDGQARLRQRAS